MPPTIGLDAWTGAPSTQTLRSDRSGAKKTHRALGTKSSCRSEKMGYRGPAARRGSTTDSSKLQRQDRNALPPPTCRRAVHLAGRQGNLQRGFLQREAVRAAHGKQEHGRLSAAEQAWAVTDALSPSAHLPARHHLLRRRCQIWDSWKSSPPPAAAVRFRHHCACVRQPLICSQRTSRRGWMDVRCARSRASDVDE